LFTANDSLRKTFDESFTQALIVLFFPSFP
jgi:hypothetical protein